jgi:hypothetical protein
MDSQNDIKNEIEELNDVIQRTIWNTSEVIEKKWIKSQYITNSIFVLLGLGVGIMFIIEPSIKSIKVGIGVISLSIFYVGFNYFKQTKLNRKLVELKKKRKDSEERILYLESELKKSKQKHLEEQRRILETSIQNIKSELDSDGDNTIDVIHHDNEFMKILKSNQKLILEMEKSENRDFTKQFVKLSNFLVDKEKNLQKVFSRVGDINEQKSLENFKKQLYQQIHFYNILRLNSLQMISSFVDDDRITFYMIYEKFDKLNVWNTNFENQFLFKMDVLNSKMDRLISEISNMSYSINTSIRELVSITEENTSSISKRLSEIGSKLDVSNLLNTINTYHTYKTYKRLS